MYSDAFVEYLELDKPGFEITPLKTKGRPAFNPKVYFKLYFYGYLNGLRSKITKMTILKSKNKSKYEKSGAYD